MNNRVGDIDKKTGWWREGWDSFDEFQRDDNPYDLSDYTKWNEWDDGYSCASYEKYGDVRLSFF